jgi:hypothetical protein
MGFQSGGLEGFGQAVQAGLIVGVGHVVAGFLLHQAPAGQGGGQ